jgi:glutathione S-transferase
VQWLFFSRINTAAYVLLARILLSSINQSTFKQHQMSTYKLYYFNGRGRAEVSRLIFAAAGHKYEDIRYEHADWPAHKAHTPLGQMPVLEYDGVKIPQSITIARFLAKQFHLAGKDNLDQAKVDAVVDTLNDLVAKYVPVRFEKDETKKAELFKTFLADELPKHLHNLEVLGKLYSDGGAFFVGKHLTWADLFFYDVGENLLEADAHGLNSYPWLKQNRAEVEKQPKIAEYLKNRPKTAF